MVAEVLPRAPELTTGELMAEIARLAIALDPEWVRRRYERALRNRRVVGKQNPDGTGTLTGHDLPADEVLAPVRIWMRWPGRPRRPDTPTGSITCGPTCWSAWSPAATAA